jgi:hypothetical protein
MALPIFHNIKLLEATVQITVLISDLFAWYVS